MKNTCFAILTLFLTVSCNASPLEIESSNLLITVLPGSGWMHRFSFFKKNAPTYAIWLETEDGEYLDSVFVTRKIATEGWIFNNGNRRIESLPVWSHTRNIIEDDGILLPTKSRPLADGITGATPTTAQTISLRVISGIERFRIVCELNHSTDFNEYWPKNARPEDPDWTGGEGGSGQPSLVYSVLIDMAAPGPWELELVGHGSPDGSDGNIHSDMESFTSALTIIESIQVEMQ